MNKERLGDLLSIEYGILTEATKVALWVMDQKNLADNDRLEILARLKKIVMSVNILAMLRNNMSDNQIARELGNIDKKVAETVAENQAQYGHLPEEQRAELAKDRLREAINKAPNATNTTETKH